MGWYTQIDGYCERTDFTYWSEPLNAVTNLAFIIVALILWRRGAGVPLARVLCGILFVIGVGSYLFHTQATYWAMAADVVPISVFILIYLYAVNRDIVQMGSRAATFVTMLFFPYAAALMPALNSIPFIAISDFYWSVPILLALYAVGLRRKPGIAQGFLIGAALLCLSITIRSLDEILCNVVPIGTHFVWHILNGVMLGWMIHVYTRHMLATAPQGR
jgi:hypothetical protein